MSKAVGEDARATWFGRLRPEPPIKNFTLLRAIERNASFFAENLNLETFSSNRRLIELEGIVHGAGGVFDAAFFDRNGDFDF